MSNADRRRLVEALMRACYRVELLHSKCIRAYGGFEDTGLEKAANALRVAAERIDRMTA